MKCHLQGFSKLENSSASDKIKLSEQEILFRRNSVSIINKIEGNIIYMEK